MLPSSFHRRRRATAWICCLMLVGTALLVGCAQRNDLAGDVASSQAAEPNDEPLDPPLIEIRVTASGDVEASPRRGAEAGESVHVVLANDSDRPYRLTLSNAEGARVFATKASPGDRGQGNAMPRTPGRYTITVSPQGAPERAERYSVTISED